MAAAYESAAAPRTAAEAQFAVVTRPRPCEALSTPFRSISTRPLRTRRKTMGAQRRNRGGAA